MIDVDRIKSSLLLKINGNSITFIQKVGEILSGALSQEKLHTQRIGVRILTKGKSTKVVEMC